MEIKNKNILIRVSEEDMQKYKKMAAKFGGKVSHLFRRAIAQFDSHYSVDKLKIQEEYCKYWQDHDREMRRMTGNLNQAMKRVNELAKTGKLEAENIDPVIAEIDNVKKMVFSYLDQLEGISNRLLK